MNTHDRILLVAAAGEDRIQLIIDHVPDLYRAKAWLEEGLTDWAELCQTYWHRMRFPASDRKRIVNALLDAGMTQRDVAAVVGTDHRTVGNDRGENSPRSPKPPIKRLTVAQRARLEQVCVDQYRAGYSSRQIAESAGVAQSTVTDYLKRAKIKITPRDKTKITGPAPESVDWRSTPSNPEPLYRHSVTLQIIRSMVEELRQGSGENQFSYDVNEALRVGDENWIRGAEVALADAQAYLQRLLAVLRNDSARQLGMTDPTHRDDTHGLYIVKGA